MKKTILVSLAVILVVLCAVYYPSESSPPGWDETHIVFESDEAMHAYSDYLVFDTDGLTVSNAYRCLSFDSPQHLDSGSWSCLEASYIMADDSSEFSMFVYPNELSATDGFPVKNLDIYEIDVDGLSVMYQEFKDRTYSFRALFVWDGYTYEMTVYSPTNSNILIDCLHRITASAEGNSLLVREASVI